MPPLIPTILPPKLQGYLLGFISLGSLTAGLFFLKFWKQTRDGLFLSFSIAFFIEGLNRIAMLLSATSNESSPCVYLVRLLAGLIILGAILRKNSARRRRA